MSKVTTTTCGYHLKTTIIETRVPKTRCYYLEEIVSGGTVINELRGRASKNWDLNISRYSVNQLVLASLIRQKETD